MNKQDFIEEQVILAGEKCIDAMEKYMVATQMAEMREDICMRNADGFPHAGMTRNRMSADHQPIRSWLDRIRHHHDRLYPSRHKVRAIREWKRRRFSS